MNWVQKLPLDQLKILFVALMQLGASSTYLRNHVLHDKEDLLEEMTNEVKKEMIRKGLNPDEGL